MPGRSMQMTDITIPPAALEAGARTITMALILAVEEDCRALALTDDERTELARACCLAMLKAWPEMEQHINWPYGKLTHLILPLTEKTDAA